MLGPPCASPARPTPRDSLSCARQLQCEDGHTQGQESDVGGPTCAFQQNVAVAISTTHNNWGMILLIPQVLRVQRTGHTAPEIACAWRSVSSPDTGDRWLPPPASRRQRHARYVRG